MNRFFPNFPTYRVTSPFGMRTLKGVTKMHNGIDLVASTNGTTGRTDSITAHTGGKVVGVGYGASQGNYLKLELAPGIVTVYYHLRDKPKFRLGDTLATGQILGYMGATGNATGAHLHFGLSVEGKFIDPAPFLDREILPQEAALTLPVLLRGDKLPQVKAMQALLQGAGFSCGSKGVDGSFGPDTQRALLAFQKARGLKQGASCGQAEWQALVYEEG